MEADRLEYPINSAYIRVVAAGKVLPAFWAHPDTGGTFPGLVALHDQWGLTAFIRRLVRRLAEAGYYVIAPDLFNQQTAATPEAASQLVAALGDAGPAYLAAALGAVQTHHHCNGDIGLLGLGLGTVLAQHGAGQHENVQALITIGGDNPAASSTPLLALAGRAFFAEAADDAPQIDAASWAQMLDFLEAHLARPSQLPGIKMRTI